MIWRFDDLGGRYLIPIREEEKFIPISLRFYGSLDLTINKNTISTKYAVIFYTHNLFI